jgi:cytochrome c oxidase subunit II
MEQKLAVLVTVVAGTMLVAIFVMVARSAGTTASPEAVSAGVARWRARVFWALVVAFVPIIAFSLTRLPYSSGSQAGAVTIQAIGHQWAWELKPDTVPAGRPIEIRVTGADVNHGFALYDANNRLVIQTQGMPGFTNTLRYEFQSPGTYQVRCLEYCGLGHHTMMAPLVVTANQVGTIP